VVVVTTTDATAIMNAYAAIKTLATGDASAPLHTLVNLSDDAVAADDIHLRIATACRRFLAVRASAAGCVPACAPGDEPAGVLIYPARTDSARALDRVADTLWAQLQVDAARQAATRHAPALAK